VFTISESETFTFDLTVYDPDDSGGTLIVLISGLSCATQETRCSYGVGNTVSFTPGEAGTFPFFTMFTDQGGGTTSVLNTMASFSLISEEEEVVVPPVDIITINY